MPDSEIKVSVKSPISQRIIATALVIGFCYWAAGVVMTLLVSVLLAYFLDPLVELGERIHLPRVLGSLLVVLLVIALIAGMLYLVVDRVEAFANDWPRYSAVLRKAAADIERRLERVESRVAEITPGERPPRPGAPPEEQRPIRSLLLRGLGSLYSILLLVTFVPFLVFFMLAGKRDIWHVTMQLFPIGHRTRVKKVLDEISTMMRSYIAGNAIVAVILAVVSWAFFWMIHLDFPFLGGMVSGALNLVPYIGAVLAWAPPMVLGLTKWKSLVPFLGVAGVLSFFHLIAVNVLVPALVGRRVRLNALAVTVALLFWGWLWGGIGLILAIPITATIKVICDHVENWKSTGRWLGA